MLPPSGGGEIPCLIAFSTSGYRIMFGSFAQKPFTRVICTKTTHASEWMINSNLPERLPRTYESHQRELVDRSFKPEDAAIEESTN
jgi:hypothetical protein